MENRDLVLFDAFHQFVDQVGLLRVVAYPDRRVVQVASAGNLGAYLHGTRIGTLVAVQGGEVGLAHDLAMQVAAANPRYVSVADVPASEVAKEREILAERAASSGKPAGIIAKMVDGQLKKAFNEVTLLGQAFVKDPDQGVEKLLQAAGAIVLGFQRYEVGAGIEKKHDDFVGEVMAQVKANTKPADGKPLVDKPLVDKH